MLLRPVADKENTNFLSEMWQKLETFLVLYVQTCTQQFLDVLMGTSKAVEILS